MACDSFFYSKPAQDDLDEIIDYIARRLENPSAAANFLDELSDKIGTICNFPKSCPIVENVFLKRKDVRKALVGSYVVFFYFDETKRCVVILRIVYGQRDLEGILKSLD